MVFARTRGATLVTGGAGFIGGHLVRALQSAGVESRVVDDLRATPLIEPTGPLLSKRVLDMTRGDLSGIDTVYHLASDKSVPLSFQEPLRYLENIESTAHLLGLCAAAGVRRVVVASTCEVYGRARRLPTPEREALDPLSPYAASKVGMEMVVKAHQHASAIGTATTIVRLFNVYGPGERPDAVIPRFCAAAFGDRLLPIEGDGAQRRDFSYIDDVVEELLSIPMSDPVPVLNLGSGTATSVLEISQVFDELCPDLIVVRVPARRKEIPEFRADVSLRAKALPASGRRVALRDGIERTLRWWSDQASRYQAATTEDGLFGSNRQPLEWTVR